MGVRGLTSFLAKHKDAKYESQVDLQAWATKKGYEEVGLVIDGNALMHKIGEGLDWDFLNGGQYSKLHTATQEYFQNLLAMGFRVTVIFDGMMHSSKLGVYILRRNEDIELIHRSIQQIKDTGETPVKPLKFIMPVLSGTIFKAAIRELGITTVCTLYEADRHVAHVASSFNSNSESKKVFWAAVGFDSVYFIFPSNAYIPLDSVSVSSSFICDMYNSEHTAKVLGIPAKYLPVLASVASNDYLSPKDLGDFHNYILPRNKKYSSSAVLDELIYCIKKNKFELDDVQKLAEYVFHDKPKTDKEKYYTLFRDAMAGYTLSSETVPYERELKRWAGEASGHYWRDTKVELPDYSNDYMSGVGLPEVVSLLYSRTWTFPLPFEDLKNMNSVLLLQSFRKRLYTWIFEDNPRVEYVLENFYYQGKFFDMRVPVSRKDALLYIKSFKEVHDAPPDTKLGTLCQVMGFPITSTMVKELETDNMKWMVCTLRIILVIAKERKKANKEAMFLFEYEFDALLASILLNGPSNPAYSFGNEIPSSIFDDILGFSTSTETTKESENGEKEKAKEREKEKEKEKGRDRESRSNKDRKSDEKKAKINIYYVKIASLYQLTVLHFRVFNEILGNLLSGYLEFTRSFDSVHFSEMYQKLFEIRAKEWDSVDDYLNYVIGAGLDTEDLKKIFMEVKACALDGLRGDDVFAKCTLYNEEAKKKREEKEVLESANKKLKT